MKAKGEDFRDRLRSRYNTLELRMKPRTERERTLLHEAFIRGWSSCHLYRGKCETCDDQEEIKVGKKIRTCPECEGGWL